MLILEPTELHKSQSSYSRKRIPLFSYAAIAMLLALAAGLITVAAIPYLALKTQLESLTLHGHADVYIPETHARIVLLLRVSAAVLAAAAAGIYVLRHHIERVAADTWSSVWSFVGQAALEAAATVKGETRIHQAVLASVVLLGLGLRAIYLSQPMRYDESYTFTHFASTPLYLTVSNFSSTNNHLLHTLLVKFSYALFGNHPWAIRLPAFIAGWLLAPASYVVARMFFGRNPALFSAGLVASSSFLILFSTNARGYTLMTLLFLLLFALAPSCLRSDSVGPWVVFSVVAALGFYTLPTMLYGFAIVAGWMLMSSWQIRSTRIATIRRLAFASIGAAALTGILYSPVVLVWGANMRNSDVLPQPWDVFVSRLPETIISAWHQWSRGIPDAFAPLLVIGTIVAVVANSRVSRCRVPVAAGIIWVGPVIVAQRVVPYDRVWIFLLPIYFVLASAGLELIWRALPSTRLRRDPELFGILGLALSLALSWNVISTQSVYYADDTGSLRDGEAIAAWMQGHLRPRDVVLAVVPADGPLEYYFPTFDLRPSDYWYSTQIKERTLEPGRRVLAVVKDKGPDLDKMLDTAGLSSAGFSDPELVQGFREASILELVATDLGTKSGNLWPAANGVRWGR